MSSILHKQQQQREPLEMLHIKLVQEVVNRSYVAAQITINQIVGSDISNENVWYGDTDNFW